MILKRLTFVVAMALSVFSCDMYDLDINVDPNNPVVASPELLLPQILEDWAADYQFIHDVGAGVMGLTSNFDGLDFNQNTFDGLWRGVYLDQVSDLDEYLKVAGLTDADGNVINPGQYAAGLILKAHIFATMVELYGDVPYTEAAKGNDDGNVNPVFDDQSVIYAECLALLDEAIGHLGVATIAVNGDMIYGGNLGDWTKAAYSMKLKLLMTVRNASGFSYGSGVEAEIRNLIDNHSADMITDVADDFAFRWNTNVDLGQRHPWTGAVYSGDNSHEYMMHQLMYEMLINHDPRIAYYFKRQTTAVLDQEDPTQANTTPCSQNSACIYGYMVLNENVMNEFLAAGVISDLSSSSNLSYIASFFGRDKADPSGIPLDGALRTAPGVWPMGGQFDSGTPSKINSSNGQGLGDGITYFISAPMVELWKAEAYLEIYGDNALAEAAFTEFLNLAFEQVESFALSVGGTSAVPYSEVATATQHTHVISDADYIANAVTRFQGAADKMDVLYKEAWYALFGSGHELYNAHRRSDYPRMKLDQSGTRGITNIQYPTFRATSSSAGQRNFPIRWPYGLSELNLNENLTEADIILSDGAEGIFWDPSLFRYN